jgi:hypothetical protein
MSSELEVGLVVGQSNETKVTHELITYTVVTIVIPTIASCFTVVRLIIRAHRRKFWWDDGWAVAGLFFMQLFVVTTVLHLDGPRSERQEL